MASNTITVRLRRPKEQIMAKAKPNLTAWINNLIDKALAVDEHVDWNEHFNRPTKRFFNYTSDKVRRAQR